MLRSRGADFCRRFPRAHSLPFRALAAPERGRVKITDIKVMMLQGPRTYTLIKVLTDSGRVRNRRRLRQSRRRRERGRARAALLFHREGSARDRRALRRPGPAHRRIVAHAAAGRERHRDRAVGPGGQAVGRAGGDAARRQVPRQRPRVSRRRPAQHARSRQLQRVGGQDEEASRRLDRIQDSRRPAPIRGSTARAIAPIAC